MLVFGHIGITLGVATLLAGATKSRRSASRNRKGGVVARPRQPSRAVAPLNHDENHEVSWLESLADYVDIRLLLVGSLLPDIIDKPAGMVFFRETLSSGRTFSHTLLFLALIAIGGFYLYRRHGKTWLLALSFGTLAHLVFDQMWREPGTLLWPIYGFAFERDNFANWGLNILHRLLTDPRVYVPELVGAGIVVWLAQSLLRRRRVLAFLKYGKA